MTTHTLKVVAPYFDALADGSKTFEVRVNDRGFQAGDVLHLREFDPRRCTKPNCQDPECPGYVYRPEVTKRVSYVFAGDPRLGAQLQPGYVVLGLVDVEVAS